LIDVEQHESGSQSVHVELKESQLRSCFGLFAEVQRGWIADSSANKRR